MHFTQGLGKMSLMTAELAPTRVVCGGTADCCLPLVFEPKSWNSSTYIHNILALWQEAVEKCRSFVFVILNGLMLMTNFIHISSPTSLVVICLWFEEGLVQHIIETASLWAQNLNMFINKNIHLFSDLLIYSEQIYCLSLLFVVQGLGRGPSLPLRHWWFCQQTAKSHKINHLRWPAINPAIRQAWWLRKVCWARDFSVLMRALF